MIVGQEPAAAEAPWTKKSDDFALLVKANWQFAVDDLKQFRPFIFWTNAGIGHHRACITARFPVHSAVARSHFSALASELKRLWVVHCAILLACNKNQTQKDQFNMARALPLLTRAGLVGSVRV